MAATTLKRAAAMVLLLLTGAAGLWFALGGTGPQGQTATLAPDLRLRSLDGSEVALRARQPTVVNLWATWCPPCRKEMPLLAEAQRQHGELRFLFVNQGEEPEVIQAYLEGQGLELDHVLLDPDMAVSSAVEAPGLPTTLFYDGQGRLRQRHLGELSAEQLQGYLRELSPRD